MKLDYKTIIPLRFQKAEFNELEEEIKKIALEQLRKKEGLYMHGGVGTGKTYIACAIAKEAMEKGIPVRFYNTGDFLEKLRDEFDNAGRADDEKGLFRDTMDFEGILFFDDIGAEKTSEWSRERLYLIINKKYEDMMPIIFTSNCDLEILSARMGDRVSSRIVEMTEVLHINGQDKRLASKM